ncbi:MAG: hypothetical protein L0Y42_16695 [Phycisphaerales bacterium]|nr:hypothetical protein [Phycisphaerales bacterium]
MSALQHIIAKAARRRLIHRGLRYGAWGVIIGLALGLLTLLAARTFSLNVPVEAYGALAAVGLLVGVGYAYATRPDRLELAVQLDRALNLRDRIGTAHALTVGGAGSRSIHDEHFAAMVNEQASRLAQSIDVRPATPIHITRAWTGAIALAAALWLGILYLPSLGWSGNGGAPSEQQRQEIQQLNQQAIEISDSIQEAIEEIPQDEMTADASAQEELEALERLAQQLAQGDPANPEDVQSARDESAARLSELADRLAQQSERDLAAADELAKRFAGMDAIDAPKPPMSAQEFSEALRRGDFGKAAQELDELLQRKPAERDLSEAERLAAAEHLRKLAEQVEQPPAEPETDQQPGDPRAQKLAQALGDLGLDEQAIDELLRDPPTSAEEAADFLDRHKIDPETAAEMMRDLQERADEKAIDQQTERDAQQVSDSLNRAADELEHPPEALPEAPPEGSPEAAPEGDQAANDDEPAPASQPDGERQPPQAERDSSREPQSQPPQKQNDPGQQQNQRDPSAQGQDQRQEGRQSRQTQPSAQPSSKSGERQSDQRQAQRDSSPDQRTAQTQPNSESRDQPAGEQSQSQPASRPSPESRERSRDQRQAQRDSSSNQRTPQTQPDSTSRGQPSSEQSQSQPSSQPSPSDRRVPQPTQRPEPSNSGQTRDSQPESDTQAPQQQPQDKPQSTPRQEQAQDRSGRQPQQSQGRPAESQENQQDSPSPTQDPPQGQPQGEPRGQPQGRPQAQPSPSDKPSQALRRLAERRGDDKRNAIQKLRDAARSLSGKMTPQERERWARQWQQQQGTKGAGSNDAIADRPPGRQFKPTATEDVDLHGDEEADQLMAEWLSDQMPAQADPSASDKAAQRIQRAQDIAERAVNESAVQKRYHKAIKRYFGRMGQPPEASPETSHEISPAPATPPESPPTEPNN